MFDMLRVGLSTDGVAYLEQNNGRVRIPLLLLKRAIELLEHP